MTLSLSSSTPDLISESSVAVNASKLTSYELRICFPVRTALSIDGIEALKIDDAPLIGIVTDISEALLRLAGGEPSAELADFYGEYRFDLRRHGAVLEIASELEGNVLEVDAETFIAAGSRWANDALRSLESRFPDLLENTDYRIVRDDALGTWRKLGV